MRRALVISGGGSKGAFAVGVVKKLLSQFPRLQFDILVGTSTGSLIVPFVAVNEMDLLEQLYTTIKTSDILLKHNLGDRLNEHSIYDATPLWNLINRYLSDGIFNKFKTSGKQVVINATCLQTGRTVAFTKDPNSFTPPLYDLKTITSADHFRKAMMASACPPVFLPPIKVNLKVPGDPHPEQQFADGGMREYAGIQMAIDQGATEIFTILLSAEGAESMNTQFETLITILERTIDILTFDVDDNDVIIPKLFNKALQYIEAVKNKMKDSGIPKDQVDRYFDIPGENPFENKLPLKIFIIRPSSQLAGGPAGLDFDPVEMKQMLAIGELAASQFVARLDPGDITWG